MQRHRIRHATEYSLVDAVIKTFAISIVTMLCVYSSLRMVQDIFPLWEIASTAQRWLNGLIFVTAAVYEIGIKAMPRGRTVCRIAIPAIYGVVFWRYLKRNQIDLEDGACAFAIQFVRKLNKHVKTSFSFWHGKEELIGMSLAFWVIVISVGLLCLTFLTGWRVWLLVLPVTVLAAELMIGYAPQLPGIILFFLGLVFLHIGEDGKKRKVLHAGIRQNKERDWYQPWMPALFLSGVVVVLIAVCSTLFDATGKDLMLQAPNVQAFQKGAEQDLSNLWNTIVAGQGETVKNQAPQYTGKEMLKVTVSQEPLQNVLLKGFCGTDYENGRWFCEKRAFQNACSDAGYKEEDAAREILQNQYDSYEAFLESFLWSGMYVASEKIDYTIEYTGNRSRYAYLPYVIDYAKNQGKERLIGDMAVQRAFGQKRYSFTGWNQTDDQIMSSIGGTDSDKPMFQWYDQYVENRYLGTPEGITDIWKFLRSVDQEWAHGDTTQLSADFMDDYYRAMLLIMMSLQETKEDPDRNLFVINNDRCSLAAVVNAFLRQYLTYSLDLGTLPEGEDPVNYFLLQSHKGYCVHFASAAVLLLRKMGVPARYVSGYVAKVQDFKRVGDAYEASVKDSDAHAWAEIYLEQVGWIPIDVTPGNEAAMNGTQNGNGNLSAKQDQIPEHETPEDTQAQEDTQVPEEDTKAEQEEDTQTGSNKQSKNRQSFLGLDMQRFGKLFAGATLLIVIVVCYMLIRFIRKRYDQKVTQELKAGAYRKAVCRMNRRIYRRLCVSGKIRQKNLSDIQYGQMLKQTYQEISKSDWEHYMQVVRVAAYAGSEMSEEDAYFCYDIYHRVVTIHGLGATHSNHLGRG